MPELLPVQQGLAKSYKKTFPQAKTVHSHVLQVAVADLDKAFQAFFRGVKAGEKAGYPRFKSHKRWDSIGFKQYGNGFRLDGRRLQIASVGRIRVRWHRPYQGIIKTCRLVRKSGRWYVSFACEVAAPVPLAPTGAAIGIDMGINALVTRSDGEKIENPRWYQEAQRAAALETTPTTTRTKRESAASEEIAGCATSA